MMRRFFNDLTLGSFKQELEDYSPQKLRKDAMAAITVSLLALPQALAHALVAGLPLSCGLLTAIFSAWIAALFGSSRYLLTGSSNAVAILLQYSTAEILQKYYPAALGLEREIIVLQILTQLTLLAGILQLLIVGFKLSRLMQFVSQSVIIGYIVGTAIALVANQLFVFLGISAPYGLSSLFEKGYYLISHMSQVQWPVCLVGLLSLGLLIGLKSWKKEIPKEALTFVLMAIAVTAARYFALPGTASIDLVGDIGDIADLSPYLSLPMLDFRIISGLLPVSFAIALLGILESTSIVRTLAADTGEPPSIDQEIFSLGVGNLTSSILGAMPLSGNNSRTMLNLRAGAQTRFSAILSSMCVWVVVLLLGTLVSHIPLAALSALMLIAAMNTIKKSQLQLALKSTGSDAFVFWVTLVACLFVSIDIAFYIGVFTSISTYLKKSALPQLVEYTADRTGKIRYSGIVSSEEKTPVRFIKIKGELFFGAVDLFQSTLKALAKDDRQVKVLILQLKNTRDLDATACLALRQLRDYLRASGIHLLLSGVTFPLWVVLSHSDLVDYFGKDNIFVIDYHTPYLYMEKTLQRAWVLVDSDSAKAAVDGQVVHQLPVPLHADNII